MGFVFLDSYFDALKDLPEGKRRLMYDVIIRYGFTGEVPNLPEDLKPLFLLIRPNVDSSKKHYADGKRGGRPRK